MKSEIRHAVLALLLSASICLTFFMALDLTDNLLPSLVCMVLSVAACAFVYRRRRLAFFVLLAVFLVFCGWAVFSGTIRTVSDTIIALTLQLSGVTGALPFYSVEATILLAFLYSFLAYLATFPSEGGIPSLSLVLLLFVLIWKTGRPDLLIPAIPAVIVCAVLSVHTGQMMKLTVLLPLFSVLAVLSFYILPSQIVLAPFKDTADQIRQRIMDYLFYTEPRNVFSLASEGWYPDGAYLGGKPSPKEHLVMVVRTPVKVYLRGAIKNEYTGHAWNDTTGGRRYLWYSPRWLSTRAAVFNETLPSSSHVLLTPLSISVQMLTGSASDLFVPQRIRELHVGSDLVPYFNQASEVFVTRDLVSGDTWQVLAPVTLLGEAGLDEIILSCSSMETDPAYEDILKTYTALPDHLSDILYNMARQITKDCNGTYECVLALSRYLKENYTYSLDVPSVPHNEDFVTHFLLDTKEGYCTYFASAMTVLCRMIGIPARYVEGYLAQPAGNDTAYITGEDGHAWTEVYFPNFGWLTVEATASASSGVSDTQTQTSSTAVQSPVPNGISPSPLPTASLPSPTPASSLSPNPDAPTPVPSSATSPSPQPESIPTPEPEEGKEDPAVTPPSAHIFWIIFLFFLITAILALRIRMTHPGQKAKRVRNLYECYIVWIQACFDLLSVQNIHRLPNETIAAFMERASPILGGECKELISAFQEGTSAVFYGHYTPVSSDIEITENLFHTMYVHLKSAQKIRYLFLRTFTLSRSRSFLKTD